MQASRLDSKFPAIPQESGPRCVAVCVLTVPALPGSGIPSCPSFTPSLGEPEVAWSSSNAFVQRFIICKFVFINKVIESVNSSKNPNCLAVTGTLRRRVGASPT